MSWPVSFLPLPILLAFRPAVASSVPELTGICAGSPSPVVGVARLARANRLGFLHLAPEPALGRDRPHQVALRGRVDRGPLRGAPAGAEEAEVPRRRDTLLVAMNAARLRVHQGVVPREPDRLRRSLAPARAPSLFHDDLLAHGAIHDVDRSYCHVRLSSGPRLWRRTLPWFRPVGLVSRGCTPGPGTGPAIRPSRLRSRSPLFVLGSLRSSRGLLLASAGPVGRLVAILLRSPRCPISGYSGVRALVCARWVASLRCLSVPPRPSASVRGLPVVRSCGRRSRRSSRLALRSLAAWSRPVCRSVAASGGWESGSRPRPAPPPAGGPPPIYHARRRRAIPPGARRGNVAQEWGGEGNMV